MKNSPKGVYYLREETVFMKNLTCSVFEFEKLRSEGYLYVDKTEYIWNLINPAGGSYFLSRPRRFGKSLTISILKAVFEGKKELFQGLAIYDKPYDWKTYPVIHLSLGDYNPINNTVERINFYLLDKIKTIASDLSVDLPPVQDASSAFGKLIDLAAKKDNVVILVDEYDKFILDNISNPVLPDIQRLMKGFYSVLKDRNDKERFLFVTGVSKFCHASLFSDLNNLTDITMDARYATMFGYTQEELEANFSDRIAACAGDKDLDSFKNKIKEWYNGFRFHKKAKTVYNPVSLAQFFENSGEFKNYWFATGTPSFLMELIKEKDFDIQANLQESVPEIAFSAFEIDDIDPLTLLLQTGYLTIKDTEEKFDSTWYFLDFPNREVANAFSAYILNSYTGKTQTGSVKFVAEIATSLLKNDLKKLRKIMEVFFAGIPYPVHKKNEATFQGIFFSIFRLLGCYIEAESMTNDGRIDAVVQTPKAIYLFEFKMDNDPTALAQIKKKEYFQKYLLDERDIYIFGVNFDTVKGNLIGWEEEKLQRDNA